MRTTERRDEIAFRKVYLPLLQNRRVTTIFRPGRRIFGEHPKGYREGETVTLRIVEQVGADWANLPGLLCDDFGMEVKILKTVPRLIGTLKDPDFLGSTPDVHDLQSLRYHLGLLYNLYPHELGDNAWITQTTLRYCDEHEVRAHTKKTEPVTI